MKSYEHKIINDIELKRCTKCNKWKPLGEFNNCINNHDGLMRNCKQCRNKIKRKYYRKNKEKINKQNAVWAKNNSQKVNKHKAKYRNENKQKLRESGKKYRDENRKTIRKRAKKHSVNWRKKNPEKYKEQYTKRNQTPKHKISACISTGIRDSIKKGSKNGRHWETLVDFTLDQLIKHLKKTLPHGYTWQDFLDGKLHIDHKIPVSVFNYETPEDIDFKKCWALKNLQLLPAKENLIKYNKIDKHFQPSLLLKEANI